MDVRVSLTLLVGEGGMEAEVDVEEDADAAAEAEAVVGALHEPLVRFVFLDEPVPSRLGR